MEERSQKLLERFETLNARQDVEGLCNELVQLLESPCSAVWLCILNEAGLLTRVLPELGPARGFEQPGVHFLPVLEHMIEAVSVVDWLFRELQVAGHEAALTGDAAPSYAACDPPYLPAAVRAFPELRYRSAFAEELRAHFGSSVGAGRPRRALFKFAALYHDVAKPQTMERAPDGSVSFYEHQTIGGEVALQAALRLGFGEQEARYIRSVVREHMRPGQLAALDEVTLRAIRRFFHATGDAAPDVLLHLLADHMATRGPYLNVAAWYAQVAWIDALLDTVWGEEIELTRPLVNGDEVMRELGIQRGPLVGRLLAAIGEAQAGGDISTRDEALALARRLLREL